MGFSMSWLAVKGTPKAQVYPLLGLVPTGDVTDVSEDGFNGAQLPTGWALVIAEQDDCFLSDELLAKVSKGAEVVACFIDEHVMVSCARGWKDGKKLWSIDHDASGGPAPIDSAGQLPEAFVAIRRDCEQQQARDPQGACDYHWEAAPALAEVLTGFRHDTYEDLVFDVLEKA